MSATGSVATEQPQPMTPMRVGEGSCTWVRNSRTEVVLSHCVVVQSAWRDARVQISYNIIALVYCVIIILLA